MQRLKDIPFFTNLSDENLKKLENISLFKNYQSNQILFYEGDEPKYLYILIDGVLRMYKTTPKGQEVYIHQFTPISMVGELANFEKIKFPATAKFVTNGTILKIEFEKLESDFFKNPDISMEIIKSLTRKVKILSQVIHRELVLSSEAKVADFLYRNSELYDKLKNNQIASLLNITPETLSRILTKLKKDGIIAIDTSHHLVIKNPKALKKLL